MHIFFFITINGYLRLVSAALSSPLHLPLLLFPRRPGLIPHGGNQILTQWLLSGSNLIARKTVSMLRMPFLFTGAAQGGAGVHVHIRLHYHLLRSLAAHSAAAFPDSCLPGRPGASCRRSPAGQARPSLVSSMNTVGLRKLKFMPPHPQHRRLSPFQLPQAGPSL